ncbi:MAG: hypothetical protein LBD59_11960 [Prevotellaceae bacterium]|nr:hypothetical protein [Prevotellaceae bacterium]
MFGRGTASSSTGVILKVPPLHPLFGRGTASSGLSWQAVPANKGANAGTACVDRVDKVEPCPNSRGTE